ncbi:MAG: HAD-IB family phosphatase [Candidatus Bathyarchaeota archaeon]|nr:MAG: HAD-IB family phosphatase [Candidatus Bathyarchaeota archaeon]
MTTKTEEAESHRLAVFDVEGVLLPKRRYLLFDVAGKLSFWDFLRILAVGFLYEAGLLSVGSALRRIFAVYKDFEIKDLYEAFMTVPLMPGAKHVFQALHGAGYKTALISSGIPTFLVENLAGRLDADYAFGIEVETVDKRLTGKIEGEVLEPDGKASVLKTIRQKEGISPGDCVVVADDRNNQQMFPQSRLRIGYNPDYILAFKSDYVVNDDLSRILPILGLEMDQVSKSIFSRNDAIRAAIHMSGFLVPFVCIYFLGIPLSSLLIFIVALVFAISELLRLQGISFPVLSSITWRAARRSEFFEIATAPALFALGIVLSLVLFPEPVGYVSIAILTLGDSMATISGKLLGRTVFPFNKGKHVEGLIFGLFFAFAGAVFFVGPVQAVIAASTGMLVGCLPLPIDDNLTTPIAAGLVLMLLL